MFTSSTYRQTAIGRSGYRSRCCGDNLSTSWIARKFAIVSLLVAAAAVGCTRTVVVREALPSPTTEIETEPEPTNTEASFGAAVGPPLGIWFCSSGGTTVSCGHDPGIVGVPMGEGYYAFQMVGCSAPGEVTWSCTGHYAASGDQEITIPKVAFQGYGTTAPEGEWWCLVSVSPRSVDAIVCGNESFLTQTPLQSGEILFRMSSCSFQRYAGTDIWHCSGTVARQG